MKLWILFFLAGTWACPMKARADQPDVSLENRLHRIYEKFESGKIDSSEWLTIAGDKEQETYTVRSGDTLWGISKLFFGDGYYWPKIWEINSNILDPHFLLPGETVVFTPGTEESAPSLSVEGQPELHQSDLGSIPPGVELPPPIVQARPVLDNIPSSLPKIIYSEVVSQSTVKGFSSGLRKVPPISTTTLLPEYMVEKLPPSDGVIAETEAEANTAGQYQYVFLKSKHSLNIGDILYSYHYRRGISSRGFHDKIIVVEGQMQVVSAIPGQTNVYRAFVTQTVSPVNIKSFVTEGRLPTTQFTTNGNPGSIKADVIGGQFDDNREYSATGSFIYLNRGSADGLNVGDLLSVTANQKVRNRKALFKFVGHIVGLVRIASVSKHFATALVVASEGAIYAGDRTGSAGLFAQSNVSNPSAPPLYLDDGGDSGGASSGSGPNSPNTGSNDNGLTLDSD